MDPYKKLAATLEARMAGHASNAVSGVPAELGTLTASGLKLDSFKYEIKDYLVADWEMKLKLPPFETTGSVNMGGTVTTTVFQFDETEIEGAELKLKESLKSGDRVLAVPVAGGTEAVVLCRVVR